MTTVFHTLRKPSDQSPLAQKSCSVKLVGVGFVVEDQAEVMQMSSVKTDDAGLLTLDLTPNSQIDTENTYYQVNLPGESWTILVPDGPGPYWLRDILLSDPQPGPGIVPGYSIRITDNGDGTFTLEPIGLVEITDNGDHTFTITI